MSQQWMKQTERGKPFLIRLIVWITLRLGRRTGRILLYPITLYFVLFSPRARKASRNYLNRVLDHEVRLSDIFKHYHCFSSTILDRIYMLSGRYQYFDVDIVGESILEKQRLSGKGCLLLGAHLGSFEVLRAGAICWKKLIIKVLMYKDNAEKINAVLNVLNPQVADSIIPIGDTDSLLKVKEAVDRGEIIGILGDRVSLDKKLVFCQFLGEDALFPGGPLLLANLLQIPVILFFGLYKGGRRYEIHFELLAERITIDQEEREQQLRKWVQQYAERIEYFCHNEPYNWFNFYDFWAQHHDDT